MPHLLERDLEYREFYRNVPGYKILDNGEAEGVHVVWRDLFMWAEEIQANEIVVPDKLGDADRTVQLARDFRSVAQWHPEFRYMGVVQGKRTPEAIKCFTFMSFQDYISVVAFPRFMNRVHSDQRRYMIEALAHQIPEGFTDVHCLGASKWVREVVHLAELPVRGMDTSLPVVMGLECKDITEDDYVQRQGDFFDRDANDIQQRWIDHNVDTFLNWAKAPTR